MGVFSFQEFKQLSTGDGSMTLVRDVELAEKLQSIWAFSGESPHMFTLNWRMNEMTAAVGLAQLQRVDKILSETYNVTLEIFNDAIAGSKWLKARKVPAAATQSGYWFACKWAGDDSSYERFKALDAELGIGLRFGFNQVAPYQYEFFRKGDIFGHGVPYHTPPFTTLSDYRYRDGLCPVVEQVMPRLVTVNLIFLPIEEARKKAVLLRNALEMLNKG
jgi:dTDP-4-amino-4,6-dideoxygalactose transaminase